MPGDDQHRCEHCGTTGQPGEGCVSGCDAPAVFEARERASRCPECLWLISHLPTCKLRPKTEREQGWNEAIEAAAEIARKASGHGCNTFAGCTCRWEERLDGVESDIHSLKK